MGEQSIRFLTGSSSETSKAISTGVLVYLVAIIGAVTIIVILKEYEIIARLDGVELRPKSTN